VKIPLLLTNNLPVVNNSVHYIYDGKATNHNNLISYGSRLLITEEDANLQPSTYSSNHATWRYYAEIPQAPIPGDSAKFSALIHIRHLFYNESSIDVLGLPGGLDFWFFRNTESVLQWSIGARDDWHGATTTDSELGLIHDLLIRMLDYLDGASNVQVDVPPGTPVLADPVISRVALLTLNPKVQSTRLDIDPPGYVDHVLDVGHVVIHRGRGKRRIDALHAVDVGGQVLEFLAVEVLVAGLLRHLRLQRLDGELTRRVEPDELLHRHGLDHAALGGNGAQQFVGQVARMAVERAR